MSSIVDIDHPIVNQPGDVKLSPINQPTLEKRSSDTEKSEEHTHSHPKDKNSSIINTDILATPFNSPTPSFERSQSDAYLEENKTQETIFTRSFFVQGEAVGYQEERMGCENRVEKGINNIEGARKIAGPNKDFETTGKEDIIETTTEDEVSDEVELTPAPTPVRNGVSAATVADSSGETITNGGESHDSTADKAQEAMAEGNATIIFPGDATLDDHEEAAIETPKNAQGTRSVPPHMRREFQPLAARHSALPDLRHTIPLAERNRFSDNHRTPRPQYPMYQSPIYRVDADREQLARMRAQLMKTQNELNASRKQNVELRTTVEAEHQHKIETAFSSMLANLLQKQSEALGLEANVEAKGRDLQYRERQIEQLEVYLAEGQKQVKYQLEQQGIRTMNAVDREHIKREAELFLEKRFADFEAKIAIQAERLRLREATQQIREQQYKSLVCESIESSFHEKALTFEKAAELAEEQYNSGYAAGKELGRKEALGEAQKLSFLEGYAACHRAQTALYNMRAGRIPRDSPELDFLFDAGHAENLLTRDREQIRPRGWRSS
ncbi:uncharacterized protein K460DRAFT_391574 [Cucurbitaria berberidis CBS 394.84]|uniref:Uncharacterized protein n=1 Tax=Cucurbitaria berberidis CBS 394.84 TaxID=1168544 RepID=A0A9P4GTX2_9PLEO|nr:uncharacterized protein K460DRAFT_391574 [Cucurbitaria berberidis CBS 394.84]KAF1851262.1 hypothetical protein K460DRAFT_391574 [Cucurbitaria berberidis CBS 394.84]